MKRRLALATLAAVQPFIQYLHGQTDWPVYGHDPGGLRYSPLTQIAPNNVAQLQRAWTFHSGKAGSQVTPLVIAGIMYITAPNGIYALEPETGKVLWKYAFASVVTRRG